MVALFDSTPTAGGASVDALHAVLDDLSSVSLATMNRAELETFTLAVLQAGQRLEAITAKAVAAADLAGVGGRKSTNAHLAAKAGTASSQIAPSRTLGVWLTHFGVLADAWEAGLITEAHVRELKKLDNGRTRRLLQRDQQTFIDMAQTLEFNDWETALQYWLLHADPDGDLDPERERTYGISARTLKNGDVSITGTLDPIEGLAFLTMLEHEAEKVRANDIEHGLDPASPKRRNSIALLRLMTRGFRRPDGTYPVPLVNIVMSERVAEAILDDITRNDGHHTAADLLQWDDPDGRCETIRGVPLHPRRTWPALLTGLLRRQILNAKSKTLDVGTDVRLFPAHMKNALLVESRGHCTNPGCTAPYAWLQADHRIPHSKGGPTSMTNGQILCQPDNHTKGDR